MKTYSVRVLSDTPPFGTDVPNCQSTTLTQKEVHLIHDALVAQQQKMAFRGMAKSANEIATLRDKINSGGWHV